MKILVADDDLVHRRMLEITLRARGLDLVLCADGTEAWQRLQAPDAPPLAILDWMMPGLDGPEICRRVRQTRGGDAPAYLIMLTANDRLEDLVRGLAAGADDYVTKPCQIQELLARLQVGMRVVELQQALTGRVHELEEALSKVKQLQGLLPICAYCKKVRDDQDYWSQVETYISRHTDVQFSHGICPDCFERVLREEV